MSQTNLLSLSICLLAFAVTAMAQVPSGMPASSQPQTAQQRAGSKMRNAAQSHPEIRLPAPPIKGEQWQPGLDYFALITPWLFRSTPGKVTVVVRHQYTVPECRDFEPALERWMKEKPSYIEVVRKPHIHYPHGRPQARMFLTLQKLNRLDLHPSYYTWIWDKAHYRTYMDDFALNEADHLNSEFAKANGISDVELSAVYGSRDMDMKVNAEEASTVWEGDSVFVVNGRYNTDMSRVAWRDLTKEGTPENYARLFRLIEYLAADELRNSAQRSPPSED